MDFSFTPEQDQLRDGIKSWLGDTLTATRIVDLAGSEAGWDPTTWQQASDFGLLDRELLGVLDLAIVAEELGYGLYAGPLLSTVAALPLLDDKQAQAAAEGRLKVSVAWSADPRHLQVNDGHVTGEVRSVADLALVDLVLIPTADGWFGVEPGSHGVEVIARATTDLTRRVGDLVLDAAAADQVELSADDAAIARQRWQVLLAAESCGIGVKALDLAKDYVTQRQQFGRVIATYQAISHKLSDIYTRTELSRSLTYWAAAALDDESIDAQDAVHAAKAYACEAAVLSCEQSIQSHGGIGFTWDHILHRYYKRARGNAAYGGWASEHRAEIAEAIFA